MVDWERIRADAESQLLAIGRASRNRQDIEVIKAGVAARTALAGVLLRLSEQASGTADIEHRFGLALQFIAAKRQDALDRPARLATFTAAEQQMADGLRTVGVLRNPDEYRVIASTLTADKFRKDGLPLDPARLALRLHITRLTHERRDYGGSDDDYLLATAELCFVRNLERLYIQLQQKTLGVEPPVRPCQ